ncbi:EF-hand domain-containing family member B [Chelonia mydas]|uniref:EF-hand domain-containing family member B n=1 Tax=Chelonia mydas TaxID=8469 RepID=M7BXM0_CHEMY|nr:EF-hand domain-containing family member B [Chelonia mydas]
MVPALTPVVPAAQAPPSPDLSELSGDDGLKGITDQPSTPGPFEAAKDLIELSATSPLPYRENPSALMARVLSRGVGDLLHNKVPSEFLRGKDRERAVFTAIRQNLKKANYHNFGTLLEAFRHYDKNGDGRIDKEELRKSCFQLNIDLDEELLDALFDYCDLDKDGLIDYLEFVNFLNWKDKMSVEEFEKNIITKGKKPDGSEPFLPEDAEIKTNDGSLLKDEDLVPKEPGTSEKTPKTLTRPTDRVFADYRTTSSQYNATVGGLPATCYPLYGVPTIRSDIPAPRIRRISDRTNYGDEANAYALLCPSVFSEKGVYERDFFKARSKAEVLYIASEDSL